MNDQSRISRPAPPNTPKTPGRPKGWINRLAASRRFQAWAARFPLTRATVRREGEALFDLISGFAQSQALYALVELDVRATLGQGPRSAEALAPELHLTVDRTEVLLNAGVAIGLLTRRGRAPRYGLSRRGAALLGVPGLREMILHHAVLYRDLADPVALLRGEAETELAGFWPYVFGAGGATDPEVTARYSDLMAQTQVLVAEDTLRVVDLGSARHLMDIGGGTGAFLEAAGKAHPALQMTLFDLPAVAPGAESRFRNAGLEARTQLCPGSFRDDALPGGADAISLIRVLYDHADDTVAALLAAVHEALPAGGRLIIAEPMTGGARPTRPGDVYFALYTMAMRTGRARSAARIGEMCRDAGFADVRDMRAPRPFVTSVLVAQKGA